MIKTRMTNTDSLLQALKALGISYQYEKGKTQSLKGFHVKGNVDLLLGKGNMGMKLEGDNWNFHGDWYMSGMNDRTGQQICQEYGAVEGPSLLREYGFEQTARELDNNGDLLITLTRI